MPCICLTRPHFSHPRIKIIFSRRQISRYVQLLFEHLKRYLSTHAAHTRLQIYIKTWAYTHAHTHTGIYVSQTYSHREIGIYICLCECVYKNTHTKASLSLSLSLSIYIYIYKHIYKKICSPMTRETRVQSQVKLYQILKKYYLTPPCIRLTIVKYVSSAKWRNSGKGIAVYSSPRRSRYWKGSLRVTFKWVTNFTTFIYITFLYIEY